MGEQECFYCGEWYYVPVGHYHSEEECLANQKAKKEIEDVIS